MGKNAQIPIIVEHQVQGKLWPQILCALAAHIGAVIAGSLMCWPTVALPKIRTDETFVGLTEDHLSWLASIVPVGAVIASFPTGIALDQLGRRNVMLAATLPLFMAWILLYFSTSFLMLISGRVIGGLCYGLYGLSAPIYIAEIVDTKIRGMMISAFELFACCGGVTMFIVGTFASWRILSLIGAVFPVLLLICVYFVPESPRFLVSKGREEEAAISLMKLRRLPREMVMAEIETMRVDREDGDGSSACASQIKELLKPSVLKAVIKCLFLLMVQIFSGIGPVTLYLVDVFTSTGIQIDSYMATIYVGLVQIVVCILPSALVDKLGRKVILCSSIGITCIGQLGFGYYFYVKDQSIDGAAAADLAWLPVPCILGVTVGYSLGLGSVPYSIVPELLPQEVRGVASSLLRVLRASASFAVTRYFKNAVGLVGASSVYWFFGACCFAGLLFVYFLIPETSGQSLEEIEKALHHRRRLSTISVNSAV